MLSEVQQTQQVFRTILDCMARPGTLGHVTKAVWMHTNDFNPYVIQVVSTLFDREVTFYVQEKANSCIQAIQLLTYASFAEMDECDFFLVKGREEIEIHCLKRGTLSYPDESTTLICQVTHLSNEPMVAEEQVIRLTLSGPGIEGENIVYLSGMATKLLAQIQDCNADYPLGLDVIAVDEMGAVLCIPRTSVLSWEVL